MKDHAGGKCETMTFPNILNNYTVDSRYLVSRGQIEFFFSPKVLATQDYKLIIPLLQVQFATITAPTGCAYV